MSTFDPAAAASLTARLRARGPAFLLAVLFETLLAIAIFSLGLGTLPKKPKPGARLVSVAVAPADDENPRRQDKIANRTHQNPVAGKAKAISRETTAEQPSPTSIAPPPPAFIPIAPSQLALLDISRVPRQATKPEPGRALMGPVDSGVAGDSKRVGSAPNGQPLYAAAWYREPYDNELSGYLSTAEGPGYALIACRTVPDWRVDDCVALDEYPSGSNLARAVLAAAWQFKVRPPRLGGVYKVGEWVRIRIDYERRPARPG